MSLEDKNSFEKIELLGNSGLKYYDGFGEMYLVEPELVVECLENDFANYSNYIILRFFDAEIVSEEKKTQILKRVNILCKKAGITSKSFIDNNDSERIELTGRAGMKYHDGLGEVYFVDSEIVAPNKDYDYAIYPNYIIRVSNDSVVSKELRDKIIERVMILCKERGMSPRLFY